MNLLKESGGPSTSLFYWSEFLNYFAEEKDWSSVNWNNEDKRINGSSMDFLDGFLLDSDAFRNKGRNRNVPLFPGSLPSGGVVSLPHK